MFTILSKIKLMAKCKSLYVLLLSCCMITPMLFSCVDNDDLANEQGTFYSATKRTAAEIISDDADRCSMFQSILEKSNSSTSFSRQPKYS